MSVPYRLSPMGNAVVPLSDGQLFAGPLEPEPPVVLIASMGKSVNDLVLPGRLNLNVNLDKSALVKDVEDPPALQLEVSARIPPQTFHHRNGGKFTAAIPTVAFTAPSTKSH